MSGRRGGRGGGAAAGGNRGGGNTGPAIMLMPAAIRATFMPNPPLHHIPPVRPRRKHPITGIVPHISTISENINKKGDDTTKASVKTPQQTSMDKKREKAEAHKKSLEPLIESYRKEQRDCGGEFDGMNCYNTLFVGRLAYEVTERKLLREMEAFGPVKDLRIIQDKSKSTEDDVLRKSRGYAFVEYEHEDDMKRAYRAADGMRLEGREIVVDVERGHTVPSWLPRRLGGGLGGTRIGGKDENYTRPGRFDPTKPPGASAPAPPMVNVAPGPPIMGGGPPPPLMTKGGPPHGPGPRGGQHHPPPLGPPPPYGGGPPPPRYGAPPPRYDDRGPRYDDRKRRRSDSPPPGDRRYGGGRNRRY